MLLALNAYLVDLLVGQTLNADEGVMGFADSNELILFDLDSKLQIPGVLQVAAQRPPDRIHEIKHDGFQTCQALCPK